MAHCYAGNSGWNMLLLKNALGEAASNLTVVATKALPWACRKEGPATVNIRGIKDRVFIVVLPDGPMNIYLATQLVSSFEGTCTWLHMQPVHSVSDTA